MSEKQSDIIDFKAMFRNYRKGWYWFLMSVVVCGLIGGFYCMRLTPLYEVRSSVQLSGNSNITKLMAGSLSGVSDLFGGNAIAEDEVLIMMSHSNLRAVSVQLGLNRTHYERLMPTVYVLQPVGYPVEVTPDESTINTDTLGVTLAFAVKARPNGKTNIFLKAAGKQVAEASGVTLPYTLKSPYGQFLIEKTKDYPEGETVKTQIRVSSHDQAAEDLRGQLNVALTTKHSQIISMQMISPVPDHSVAILNALVDQYNAGAHRDNLTQTSATASFLSDRLDVIRQNLNKTESAIADYKTTKGLSDLETDAQAIATRMYEAEKMLTEQQVLTEMDRVALEMVRASAKDNSLLPYHTSSEGVAALIKSYNNMVMQRMQLEVGVKGDNATVARMDEQIAAVRQNLVSSLESSLARSQDREESLRRIYNKARGEVSDVPSMERNFRDIARQREIEEHMYVFLLEKIEESAILMNEISPKVKIIDRAYALNEDISSSPMMIMAVAICFGLLCPALVIYILDFIRTSKKEEE